MLNVISRIVRIKGPRPGNILRDLYNTSDHTKAESNDFLLFVQKNSDVKSCLPYGLAISSLKCEIVSPFSTKTTEVTQPCPQGSLLPSLFLVIACDNDVLLPDIAKVFQIWSTLAVFEEIAGGFEQIGNGEYFE